MDSDHKQIKPDIKVLNLGAGKDDTLPGAVTIDISKQTNPDIVHDLNQTPWPLESDSFNEIYCRDVIEHLEDLVKIMEEIHRVGANGAKVQITTPHYSCANAYTDPTHKQRLGFFSFDYFTGENDFDFYTKVRFKKLKSTLLFHPTLINKLIWRLANRYPAYYEKHLAWIFPAWYMSFELEVVK